MKVSTTFETSRWLGEGHILRIGDHAIRANSKLELQAKVSAAIGQAFTTPRVGLAKVGNQVMVVVEHLGNIETYAADISGNGVAELRNTSSASVRDELALETATTGAALHLFKCDPTSYESLFDGKVPAGMPESRVSDWLWYAKAIKEKAS